MGMAQQIPMPTGATEESNRHMPDPTEDRTHKARPKSRTNERQNYPVSDQTKSRTNMCDKRVELTGLA